MGATVRDHRNAVRDRSESVSAINRNTCPQSPESAIATIPASHHTPLVVKSVLIMGTMMILFFADQPVAKVAIVGGALLLFTRRVKAEKVYREIDWPLLVMFIGLFK